MLNEFLSFRLQPILQQGTPYWRTWVTGKEIISPTKSPWNEYLVVGRIWEGMHKLIVLSDKSRTVWLQTLSN